MKKTLIIVAMLALAARADAAQYSGKKFRMTITKTESGRVVEGEVWDTTRSEHTLVIRTVPQDGAPAAAAAAAPSADATIGIEGGRLIFK